MKTLLKVLLGLLALVVVLAIGVVIWAYTGTSKNKDMDFEKILSQQSAVAKDLPPLENIEKTLVDVTFIDKHDSVVTRQMKLYYPRQASQPLPTIWIPHYEISEDSKELRNYLEHGWLVASVNDFQGQYNAQSTDDDLVFNNAALYTLRRLPKVDTQRIALVGGSAGGYTTLMLNGLQMGICASLANAPVANLYFNDQHFTNGAKLNKSKAGAVMVKMVIRSFFAKKENVPAVFMNALMEMPIPFLAMLQGSFDKEGDPMTIDEWTALSPVGLADGMSSPFVINHFTSDMLVPVDQISRRFTYEKNGETLPESFSTRMDPNNPGVLGRSLEELLPEEWVSVERIMLTDPNADGVIPYDSGKMFNLNIFDDGPVEAYSSHRASMGDGFWDDTPYLAEMFSRSLAQTEILRPGKLLLLLQRYQGNSKQLPAHKGVDDSVYGSLAVYQQEVIEELSRYIKNHSLEEVDKVAAEVIANDDALTDAWKEIRGELKRL